MSDNDDIVYEDDPPHPRYVYQKNSGGKFDDTIKHVGVALIIAGLIGLIGMGFALNGAIANLQATDAVHATSLQFLREQMQEVKDEQRSIRGKVYRSDGSLAGDFSADERQSQ